jgi:hypothetical protein
MIAWWRRMVRRMSHGRPVVVVSGLPRSGTSVMMKMLEAGGVPVWVDGVRGADELNPRGYYELERVKDLDKPLDKRWVREGRGRAIKVVSSLLEHLPGDNDYRVVFMHRDLVEVLSSQRQMLTHRGESADPEADERLRPHLESHLRHVTRVLANGAAFQTVHVDYAEVLTDPRRVASRLNGFLGGNLDVDRMAEVIDRTLYRHRRKEL